MNIADLNHIETVSTKESSITGGNFALALANSTAAAIGRLVAATFTSTDTTAIFGKGAAAAASSSRSGSFAA